MNWINRIGRKLYHRLPLPGKFRGFLKQRLHPRPMPLIPDIHAATLDRKAKLLFRISPASQDGLEIGPLCNPIVSKSESGGRIGYVDIANAEKLIELNKVFKNVRLDEIVETDFIVGEKSLPELVGEKKYDYVVASHVIEHVPNMLGWLKELGAVLKDDGILSLAIPDKRYTFDLLREPSTPGMLIEAYLLHRRQPGPREVFDFAFQARTIDAAKAWDAAVDKTNLPPFVDLDDAYLIARYCLDHYKDAHVNVFTPASFLDLIEITSRLDLVDFTLLDFLDTAQNTDEFFVSMVRNRRAENRKKSLERQLAGISRSRQILDRVSSVAGE
jgi:SAM-dependent methyltransferase